MFVNAFLKNCQIRTVSSLYTLNSILIIRKGKSKNVSNKVPSTMYGLPTDRNGRDRPATQTFFFFFKHVVVKPMCISSLEKNNNNNNFYIIIYRDYKRTFVYIQ